MFVKFNLLIGFIALTVMTWLFGLIVFNIMCFLIRLIAVSIVRLFNLIC